MSRMPFYSSTSFLSLLQSHTKLARTRLRTKNIHSIMVSIPQLKLMEICWIVNFSPLFNVNIPTPVIWIFWWMVFNATNPHNSQISIGFNATFPPGLMNGLLTGKLNKRNWKTKLTRLKLLCLKFIWRLAFSS